MAGVVCILYQRVSNLLIYNLWLRAKYGVIIIIFLHGLGRVTCLTSFRGVSAILSSSGLVGEGVLGESGVVRSFQMVDPVLFVLSLMS